MNKHLLSVVTALLFPTLIFAQQAITFTSADMPGGTSIMLPWSNRIAVDTLPLPSINFGQKGANKVYDFSNLSVFRYDTVEYRALTNTQQQKFSAANIAITTDGRSFIYGKHTANTNFTLEGLEGDLIPGYFSDVQFSPKSEVYKFPTQYGGTFSGSYGSTKIIPGSDINQPFVGNVRVVFTADYNDTIDGWGKVITPVGAYKCLRVKRVEKSRTKIDASSLFQPNNYNQAVSDTRDTTIRYSYLTKEAKGSVITFTFDTFDNVTSASWSMIPPAAPVADFTYGVGPNGQVTFTDNSDGYPDSWTWDYGDNTANGSQQNPSHTYAANGSYYVCLTTLNAGGSTTYCDSVRVTTIASVNKKPLAKNDSTTCIQGDSVLIAPLTNDSDPDFNSLSITNVYAAQNGTATLTGATVKYKPNTAFTGWDYFDYRICDNGSPVLCDTGRVYINVTPKPANKKPVAGNDSTTCQQPDSITINALSNDSDPDANSLSVTAVFNFQNGSATTNGVTIVYKPNASFSGWDYFDYKICDNGSPSLCDTGRVFVNVLPEPVVPVPPVADFNYTPNDQSSTCGFLVQNTSTNADSIVWKFTNLGSGGKDSTIINKDSLDFGVVGFVFNYKVCLYAFNDDGMDSVCTTLTTGCVGIDELEKNAFALYPNPARDAVFVKSISTNIHDVKAVRLYDLAGRMVHETPIIETQSGLIEINTSAIQTGSYIAEILLRDDSIGGRSKLMIQK